MSAKEKGVLVLESLRMSFWSDKIVLVTGGHGFLGTNLVRELSRRRCRSLITPRSEEWDLRVPAVSHKLLKEVEPDIVFHLAAKVGGIGINKEKPAEFFFDNLMMSVPLLHQSWEQGVSKFVSVGTVCSYPKHTPVPFVETDLWNGYPEETNAPYGLAKKMMVVAGMAYRTQYNFSSIHLLPANLYGPGDNFAPDSSHVIPSLIKKCLEAKESGQDIVEVWGTGKATREFLNVKDAARGIVMAAQEYDAAEPVNLGSGQEISIQDLADLISELTGYEGEFRWNSNRPDGQPRRCLDVSRAFTNFGFRAEIGLREGLQETIAWYREFEN